MSALSCCSICCAILVALFAYPLYWVWMPPLAHEIKGKCAVVTGTSSGLGIDVAKALANEGVSKLILTARRIDKLQAVANDMSKQYPSISVYPVQSDVTSDEDNEKLVATARDKFGQECPIILVNNAGVEKWVHIEKTTKGNLDFMLDVNLKAAIHLTVDFLPFVIKSGGHVVFMGSVVSKVSGMGVHTYAASKFGLLGFAQGLRSEMRKKNYPVTVHTIMPGFVKNSGMAEDVAKEAGVTLDSVTEQAGYCFPEDVGNAVVGSIKFDHPEWVVNTVPTRVLAIVSEIFPRTLDLMDTMQDEGSKKIQKFFYAIMDTQTVLRK